MNQLDFLNQYIGKNAVVEIDVLKIQVKILDGRFSFGRVDLLCTPIAGSGQKYFTSNKVSLCGKV